MNIADELNKLADRMQEKFSNTWGEAKIAGLMAEMLTEVRTLSAVCADKVLVKPIVGKHPQGYMTGKTHFVAHYGASGNFYGKTAAEALASLDAGDPDPKGGRRKPGG